MHRNSCALFYVQKTWNFLGGFLNNQTKDNLRILVIGVLAFALATLLTSCGTTSVYRCNAYIGPEKEYCLQKHNEDSRNLDYRQFRGGLGALDLWTR